MSIAQRDYILRLIEQFAAVLAQVMGLRKAGKPDEALKLVRETSDKIFGPIAPMLERVDAGGAAALLGSVEKLAVYAALTAEEAEIADAMGNSRKAQFSRRRALELYLEASRMGPLDARSRAAVQSLRQTVNETQLEDRYRELMSRLPPIA